ncbi:TlpA family protein disulfide reductase [Ketobacter alkanivorans]|uniref:Redoxin n=1 Tax=Ketobacter alkanivorans TaxID=1917421 RepID=A0A2K9LNH3_9GAMM|nr:TlpA disulfide reductase family protein [Ketobacter alkanivorans]AUM13888.1 redoxin [Ketobacter alkanivorans]
MTKRNLIRWMAAALFVPGLLIGSATFAKTETLNGPAPDFKLPMAGKKVLKLSDLKGDVVMINFWASWCGPCREEMPLIEGIYQKYKKLGFTVYGVNVDANPKDAQQLLKETGVSFPVGYDTKNKVSELYKVDSMPSTVMVDRKGNMRFLHRGYKPGYEQDYEKQIRQLIRE